MPKTKTVSLSKPTRQSPRAKKARVEAEAAADKEEDEVSLMIYEDRPFFIMPVGHFHWMVGGSILRSAGQHLTG